MGTKKTSKVLQAATFQTGTSFQTLGEFVWFVLLKAGARLENCLDSELHVGEPGMHHF